MPSLTKALSTALWQCIFINSSIFQAHRRIFTLKVATGQWMLDVFQFFHTQKSNLQIWTDSLHVILLPTYSKRGRAKSTLVSAGRLEAKKNWFSWVGLAWGAPEIICLPSRHSLNTQRHPFVISAALSLQNASSLHDGAPWPAGWECACLLPCVCIYWRGKIQFVFCL